MLKKGKLPTLKIAQQGFVTRCLEPCMKIGAFCEAPRKILTEEEKRYIAERIERARKAKEARKAERARKAEEARLLAIARAAKVARRRARKAKMLAEARRKAELARKAKEARKMGQASKSKEAKEKKKKNRKKKKNSKKQYNSPKHKPHRHKNKKIHKQYYKQSTVRPSKQIKTELNHVQDKPQIQYSVRENDIKLATEQTIHLMTGEEGTASDRMGNVNVNTPEKANQVKENPDVSNVTGKSNR